MFGYSISGHFNESVKNSGIRSEWAFCSFHGVNRTKHDNGSYESGSDLEFNGHGYSVKANAFTLMSGTLCKGQTTFAGIWDLFVSRVHSDIFAYVTKTEIAYEMNLQEFSEFVHEFGYLERESAKNGGGLKIRCRKESKKMLAWLAERAEA